MLSGGSTTFDLSVASILPLLPHTALSMTLPSSRGNLWLFGLLSMTALIVVSLSLPLEREKKKLHNLYVLRFYPFENTRQN